MTVPEACDAYLCELEARNVRKSTLATYRSVFRHLRSFAAEAGIARIDAIDKTALRTWREQWTCAHSTQGRVVAQLRAFFAFARKEGWTQESPLEGIRKPKCDARPTMPLSRAEMRALLAAAATTPREQALLLVLRYAGLAIRDAVTLRRDALQPSGDLILRRAKSGELVTVALPEQVVAALEAAAWPGREQYFWTGRSDPGTAVNYWRSRLSRPPPP